MTNVHVKERLGQIDRFSSDPSECLADCPLFPPPLQVGSFLPVPYTL